MIPFCFPVSEGKVRDGARKKSLELSYSLSGIVLTRPDPVKCVGTIFVAPMMRGHWKNLVERSMNTRMWGRVLFKYVLLKMPLVRPKRNCSRPIFPLHRRGN